MEIKDIISSGLLELYISGLTSIEETRQVDQWVSQYPEVKDELNSIQEAMEIYALDHAIKPDDSIKAKILSRIADTGSSHSSVAVPYTMKADTSSEISNPDTVVKSMNFYKFLAAASVILLIISSSVAYNFYSKYKDTNEQFVAVNEKLKKDEFKDQAMHSAMEVMTNKYARPVMLNGTPHSPEAVAKIYWMKDKGGDVYVDPTNLPDLPTNKQYQLWAIIDGKPADAGMISKDKGTYHIQKMKSFGNVQAFAITMETDGGNPTPKGDMIVISKI